DLARPGGLARQGGRRQRAHGRFAATAVGPAARAPRQADAEDRRPPPGGRALTAPDVTLISPYPVGGERHGGLSGVAGYTARLAGALADRGAEVAVIAPTEDGAPTRECHGAVTVERRFTAGPAPLPAPRPARPPPRPPPR